MALDFTRFLIGQTLAEREGVDSGRAGQLAFFTALFDSPLGFLLVRDLAHQEAAQQKLEKKIAEMQAPVPAEE